MTTTKVAAILAAIFSSATFFLLLYIASELRVI